VSPEETTTWSDRANAEIQAALDGLAEDLSDVPVQVAAQRGYAADVLLDASRASDLLVMGRHDPLLPMGSHLGPIVRAVLREARCPVLLVDPERSGRRHLGRDRASGGVAV
jgi:nucleotide-binding universal stress UspA family protein